MERTDRIHHDGRNRSLKDEILCKEIQALGPEISQVQSGNT